MPITINCGLNKKLGTANFGSVGATCNVSFEAAHDLLDTDLAGFHQKVKSAYIACRQAVEDELAREQAATYNGNAAAYNGNGNGDGRATPTGDGNKPNGNARNAHSAAASDKQLEYARQLAKSIQGLGIRRLDNLTTKMFGKSLVALTTLDASGLIDTLKSIKAGEIDITAVLGAAA